MAPPRFFCPQLPHPRLPEQTCALDPDQTRHARKVLRLKPGRGVELFNGNGLVARAILEEYIRGLALCRVVEAHEVEPARPRITVASALPKGTRADELVTLLAQFGADRFIPLLTERAEVDPRQTKIDRFVRTAHEVAKQSGRPFVMHVEPRTFTLDEALAEGADLKLITVIGDHPVPDLSARARAAGHALVLVGPVGDWTDGEVDRGRGAGFVSWSISPHVLRVENAAAAAACLLRYLAM